MRQEQDLGTGRTTRVASHRGRRTETRTLALEGPRTPQNLLITLLQKGKQKPRGLKLYHTQRQAGPWTQIPKVPGWQFLYWIWREWEVVFEPLKLLRPLCSPAFFSWVGKRPFITQGELVLSPMLTSKAWSCRLMGCLPTGDADPASEPCGSWGPMLGRRRGLAGVGLSRDERK